MSKKSLSRLLQYLLFVLVAFSFPISVLVIINTPYEILKAIEPPDEISRWIVTFYVAMVGVVLYWLRENFRLGYGVVEIAFALYFLQDTVMGGFFRIEFFLEGIDPIQPTLQTCGALYVFVRGLDNIGVGLRQYQSTAAAWEWLCLKRPSPDREKQIKAMLPWKLKSELTSTGDAPQS